MIYLYFQLLPGFFLLLFFLFKWEKQGWAEASVNLGRVVHCGILSNYKRRASHCLLASSFLYVRACVPSSVNKVANLIKKWLFHMPMIFKGFSSEKTEMGGGLWNKMWGKREGWITKYTEISFAKAPSSLLPSFSKALRCLQASRPEEEWRHSGMDFWRLILAQIQTKKIETIFSCCMREMTLGALVN